VKLVRNCRHAGILVRIVEIFLGTEESAADAVINFLKFAASSASRYPQSVFVKRQVAGHKKNVFAPVEIYDAAQEGEFFVFLYVRDETGHQIRIDRFGFKTGQAKNGSLVRLVAASGERERTVQLDGYARGGETVFAQQAGEIFRDLHRADRVRAGRAYPYLVYVENADHIEPSPNKTAGPSRGRRQVKIYFFMYFWYIVSIMTAIALSPDTLQAVPKLSCVM